SASGSGESDSSFTDAGENRLDGMVLFGNSAPLVERGSCSLIGLLEKSPRRSVAVNVRSRLLPAAWRISSFWKPANPNSLFLRKGPPSVAPNWFRLSRSCRREKKFVAFRAVLRTNQNTSP